MPDETQQRALPSGVVRDNETLVGGDDQPYFPARLGKPQYTGTDEYSRPCYTVTPRLRRVVAEWVAITAEATSDHLRFRWDGDDLIVIDDAAIDHDDPASTANVERIHPDADRRYFLEGWLWHLPDDAAEHLDDNGRAALALLANDNPQPAETLIRYVAEYTHPAPDPRTIQDIRRRHGTSANPPEAPAPDTDPEEAHDE